MNAALRVCIAIGSLGLFVAAGPAAALPCAGFTDVEDTSPFCGGVAWMKNRGVTLGCAGTTYCPNDSLTRLAMSAFMYRLGNSLLQAPSIPRANTLSTLPVGAEFETLIIGPDGLPAGISYTAIGGVNNATYVKCLTPDCSIIASPRTIAPGYGIDAAIGADGYPVIAYVDSGLRLAICEDLGCNATPTTALIDPGYTSGKVALAISLDGSPIVAYLMNNSIRVVKCGSPRCAGPQVIAVPLSPVYGNYLSLSIGLDGRPIIGYFPGPGGTERIGVIKCSTVDCIGAVTQTFVDFGEAHAIAIGRDGLPRVLSTGLGVLRLGVCPDTSCSQPPQWTDLFGHPRSTRLILALNEYDWPVIGLPGKLITCLNAACTRYQATDAYGTPEALAIRGDGTPIAVFSSYGGMFPGVRVLGCANVACVSNWTRR